MRTHHHYETIAKAIEYIRDQHTNQPSLDAVARHVHMSPYHLQRVFKQWAGISPKAYLQHLTLESAKAALRESQTIMESAYTVGLSSNSRLHDLFIKIEGFTPQSYRNRGAHLSLYIDTIDTPFGKAQVIETERGINHLTFDPLDNHALQSRYPNAQLKTGLRDNGKKVQDFFQHWRAPQEPISLSLSGTPFQIQVWRALLAIPPAKLLAYQNIAQLIDKPKASRAVGSAIAKNPIAYLIPCHRVIRNDGEVGHYRWGTTRKWAMHAFEQTQPSNAAS